MNVENLENSGAPSYRALKAVVIILGALILLAFGALVGGLLLRGGTAPAREAYLTTIPAGAQARFAGAEIAGDRLIVRVEDGAGGAVVVIDVASGRVIGRVVLQAN